MLVCFQPKLVRTINRRRFDKALRTLHELCQWGAKDGLNRLRSIHKVNNARVATGQGIVTFFKVREM